MTTTPQTQTAVAGCIEALNRSLALVAAVDDRTFAHAPDGHGSIGEHLRHCIDHFDCFLAGAGRGAINYDARARNNELETNRAMAENKVQDLVAAFEQFHGEPMDNPVTVVQMASPGSPIAEVTSTVERELLFLSGHTVHHLALMVLLAERLGATPSTELGVAYSTLAHRAAAEG